MKNNPKGVEIIDVQIIKQKLEKLEQQGGGENVLKSYKFDNGIESVLNSIKDSNSEQSGLAEYLLGKLDILSNVSLERYDYSNPDHYSKENDLMVRGKYLLSKNKILIHTAVIPNNKRFEQTFLHESIHALTHYLINTNNSDLTDAEIKAKEQLTKLYTTVKTKLETKYKDEFSNAFSNVDEFITESFTNKKFQELLNDTKIQGGSVRSKFINIAKGIFSNVKSGSALEKILTTGIQAIEVQTTTSEAKTKIELQKTLTQEELDEAEEYMKECEVGRKKVVNSKKSTKFGR